MPDPGRPPDAGAAEWLALSESLVRGLVHALNNRLTALSALAELSAMGDEQFTVDRVLPAEVLRLQELSALFRLLVSDEGAGEAMELAPVLDEALALQEHHAGLRGVRCTVALDGASPTLRAPHWALLRLVLVLLENARGASLAVGRDSATLRVGADEHWITLDSGAAPSPYALAMARRCGAGDDVTGVLRIPTLLERRRREGRAALTDV